jgi:hypothetical protein
MPDVGDALKIWRSAVSAASTVSTDDNLIPGFVLAALVPVVTVAIHVLGRRRGFESGWSRIPAWGRGLMLGVMLVLMSLYHGEGSGFIYAGF